MDQAMPQDSAISSINLLLPDAFTLAGQDKTLLDKIRDEVFDHIDKWETQMTPFFGEMNEAANSWRVMPRDSGPKRPQGLFNSKSGETNRAVNTLATLWFRMLTASDPYFEAIAEGMNEMGQPMTETDLWGVEALISKQLEQSQYKRKLLKTLRSLALFGTAVVEEPYVIRNGMEYTDFNNRSMLLTAFDPTIFDMDFSDFIAFIDFPSAHRMRALAQSDPDTWEKTAVEAAIADDKGLNKSSNTAGGVLARIQARKQRAGYTSADLGVNQLITYHGKLDVTNPILQEYWQKNNLESSGMQIQDIDWTVSIYGGEIVRLHHTPYGDWHSIVKVAHINEFELEPIGYGAGKIGKKLQRELDVTQSRLNDILMFSLFSMFKVSKYAGLKANQFNIKPWNIIELEDITQLDTIKPDINAIKEALSMQEIMKEDFRATTGATTNLQAVATNATATEASLTQTEAMRAASVNAEVIAETLVRAHVNTMHLNNINMLSSEVAVSITGQLRPQIQHYNRTNIPRNMGFRTRVTTDKDFRPERQKNLLQGLQLATSVRNLMPNSVNVVRPLLEEWFRSIGINPRILNQPIPLADQMIDQARRMQLLNGGGGQSPAGNVKNEVKGEAADEASGFPNVAQTPVGPTPVSPAGSSTFGG